MKVLDISSVVTQVTQLTADKQKLMAEIPLNAIELYRADNRNTTEEQLVYIHLPKIEEYYRIEQKIIELENLIAKYDLELHIKQLDNLIFYTRELIKYMKENEDVADYLPQQELLLQKWLKERYQYKRQLVVILR